MDDTALMQRAAQDDTFAFGELVQRHQQRLVRFARRMLRDGDLAEDVVQDAFLRLWRMRTRYRPHGSLQALLLRMVRNLCLDYARATTPAEPLDNDCTDTSPGPETTVQGQAMAEAVRYTVLSLSEPQRAVFILSQYEGLSYREIAEVLGCPVGTVASRKAQATAALQRRLADWQEGEGAK
jgi:RNA polymerase sigma-70 factor (ECF subfamily)